MNTTDVASFTYEEPSIAELLILVSFFILLNIFGWLGQWLLSAGLLGQILVGIIYGTPVAKWLLGAWQETFVALGYLGLLLVVFEGGMSSSITHLSAVLPLSVGIALTGILVPMALSFILAPMADFSYLHCFAAGSSLASTSLGTTLAVLNPRTVGFDLRQTKLGTALLSAAIMDDVVAFIFAELLEVIGDEPEAAGSVLGANIGRTVGVTIGIGLVCLPLSRYILRPVYGWLVLHEAKWTEKRWGGEPFLLFLIVLLFMGLIAATGYAGTSPLYGAYLAGLIVAFLSQPPAVQACAVRDGSVICPAKSLSPYEMDIGRVSALSRAVTYPGATVATSPSVISTVSFPHGRSDHIHTKHEDDAITLVTSFDRFITPLLVYLLLPMFFGSIGYSIPFVPLWRGQTIWRGIIYAVLMSSGKAICGLWLLLWKRSWKGWRGAMFLGFAMIARGEIGLLISQIAYGTPTPLLVENEFLVVVWAIVICTIVGPVGVGFTTKRWGKRVLEGGWD